MRYGIGEVFNERFTTTCTCVGIHQERVEPALPILRTEAPQDQRSCASSLKAFTLSLFHRVWPKTRGLERGSRSAVIVAAHVFRRPPVRLHLV